MDEPLLNPEPEPEPGPLPGPIDDVEEQAAQEPRQDPIDPREQSMRQAILAKQRQAQTAQEPSEPSPATPLGYIPTDDLGRPMRQARTSEELMRQQIQLQQKDRDQELMQSFQVAVKQNPALAGEMQTIAKQLGLPTDVAVRNPDQVRVMLAVRNMQRMARAGEDRVLMEHLRDPEFAAVAHDDLENLSYSEKWIRGYQQGKITQEKNLMLAKLRAGDTSVLPRMQYLATQEKHVPLGFVPGFAEYVGQWSQSLPDIIAGAAAGAALGGTWGMVGGPAAPVSIPAGILSGAGYGALAAAGVTTFMSEGGATYGELLRLGVDETTASRWSYGVGAVNTLLEFGSFKVLGAPIKHALRKKVVEGISEALLRPTAGKAALKLGTNFLKGTAAEVSTEILQELTQMSAEELGTTGGVVNWGRLSDKKVMDEYAARLGEIAAKTAMGVAPIAGFGPAVDFLSDRRRAAQSKQEQAFIQGLAGGAEKSEVRGRNRPAYEAFLRKAANGTAVENLYVDAESFAQSLQAADAATAERGEGPGIASAEQLQRDLPDLMKQAQAAAANGGDVVIPIETFYGRMAGTEVGKALMQHLRVSPESMSALQAETFAKEATKRAAEAKRILTEKEGVDDEFAASAGRVEDTLFEQLQQTHKMQPDEARTNAQLIRDFVITNAAEEGETPEQFFAKRPLRVLSAAQPTQKAAAGEALDQDEAEKRDLVAVHNLSSENLVKAAKLGGLPVPSVAITKAENPMEWSGDVTLLARPDVVDPEKGDTPVFDSDAYTGRFPDLIYKKVPIKKGKQFIDATLRPTAREINPERPYVGTVEDDLYNNPNPVRAAESLANSEAGRVAFLRSRGQMQQLPMRKRRMRWDFSAQPALVAWWAEHGVEFLKAEQDDQSPHGRGFIDSPIYGEFSKQVLNAIDAQFGALEHGDMMSKSMREYLIDEKDGRLFFGRYSGVVNDLQGIGRQEFDDAAVHAAVQALRPEFEAWARAQVAPLFEPPTVKVGRRQLPVTLQNVVDAMVTQNAKGKEAGMTFGAGKTRATMAKRYRSLADIKAARERIVGPKEHETAKEQAKATAEAYRTEALEHYDREDWRGNVDTWSGLDDSMRVLAEIGKRKEPTDGQIRQALSRHGFRNIDASLIGSARAAMKSIREVPVDYFEAKPQRAVMLNEFAGAVIRGKASPEVRQALEDAGVTIREYDEGTDGRKARADAITALSKEIDATEPGGLLFQDETADGAPPKKQTKAQKRTATRINRSQGAIAGAKTREAKAVRDALDGKLDLLAWVALMGGIRRGGTWPGSTLPEHLNQRGWGIMRVFNETKGLPWEQMAEKAKEEGWFGEIEGDTLDSHTFVTAVENALAGEAVLHPKAFEGEKGVVAQEFEALIERENDQANDEFDPDVWRFRAAQSLTAGDENATLYAEMRADAIELGRTLPEEYFAETMTWDGRRVLELAALADTVSPNLGEQIVERAAEQEKSDADTIEELEAAILAARRDSEPAVAIPDTARPGAAEGAEEAGSAAPDEGRGDAAADEEGLGADERVAPAGGEPPINEPPATPGAAMPEDDGEPGGRAKRGAFLPKQLTMLLYEKGPDGKGGADASTFLHEAGHYFLTVYGDLAAQPNASPGVRADMDALLQWFGVKDIETWNAMSLEEQRKHHESFAYNFELYLHTGKAPTLELQPMFARFRRWLTRVYKNIRGRLNATYRKEFGEDLPILTGEVRAVMDRMVASREQIEHAEAVRGLSPLFESKEQFDAAGGQASGTWEEYQKALEQARESSVTDLTAASMRQMQWLTGARSRELKRLQQEQAGKRAAVRKQVDAELGEEKVYRAIERLKHGTVAGEDGKETRLRLQTSAVRAMFGEDADKLGFGPSGMLAEDGMPPDIVAGELGFASGEQMVRAILDAQPLEEAAEARTDQRMLETYGDMYTDEQMEARVEEALHNEARTRFAAVELNHLQGGTQPVNMMNAAAKDLAQRIIAGRTVKSIRPRDFALAAARADREAKAAALKRDSGAAINWKRKALLQHHLAKAALEARAEIDKALADWRKFFGGMDKLSRGRDIDLIMAGKELLGMAGIERASGVQPRAYLQKLREYMPDLYDEKVGPLMDVFADGQKHYADMTLDEFRDLKETLGALWFTSKRSRQIDADGKLELRTDAIEKMGVQIEKTLGKIPEAERRSKTKAEKRNLTLAGALAALKRVEHVMRMLDGGTPDGPFQRYVFRPLRHRFDRYLEKRQAVVLKMRDLIRGLDLTDQRIAATEPGEIDHTFTNKAELIGALLHMGNLSNLGKLIVGWRWAELNDDGGFDRGGWDRFVARMVRQGVLTENDFDFAQSVWDLNESLKPDAQKTHHETEGYLFEEVEPQPFQMHFPNGKTKDYRGGYVPARVDVDELKARGGTPPGEREGIGGRQDLAREITRSMRPSTGRGFTKKRVNYNEPLALDVRRQLGHLDDVVRFTYLQPAVRDVDSLLRDPRLASLLNRYDPTLIDGVLEPWLDRTSKNQMNRRGEIKAVDLLATALRRTAGMAAMILNVVNANQNITGLSNALLYVKPSYLRAGATEAFWRPRKTVNEVADRSKFMDERLRMEMGKLQDDIALTLDPSWWGGLQRWTTRHAYVLQRVTQNRIDIATWLGAYNQALAELGTDMDAEATEKEAVARADSAVRLAQGSTSTADVARYEAGTPFARLFTQFGGYFNTILNQIASAQGGPAKAKAALLGFLIPTIVAGVIAKAWSGDDPDDDGILDDVAAEAYGIGAAKNLGRGAASLIPGIGPALTSLASSEGNRLALSPATSAMQAAYRGVSALIAKAYEGKDLAGSDIKDLATAIAMLTGVPVTPLGRAAGYELDVRRGAVRPFGVADRLRGLVTGRAAAGTR